MNLFRVHEQRAAVKARHNFGFFVTVIAVVSAIVIIENALVASAVAYPGRLATDFSPAFLQHDLDSIANSPPTVVFLGDSVLWGYRLAEQQTAIAQLAANGMSVRNLAFKAGSAPNDFVMVRLLQQRLRQPRAIVIEVNQKTLNQADNAYQKLHPALDSLGASLLDANDRRLLGIKEASVPRIDADALLSGVSLLYAMRSDIRERLYGASANAPPTPTSADAFEGTYDLAPLDRTNVGVHFFEETARILATEHVTVIAFSTPTNHRLLHEYIDNPQYRTNGAYLRDIFNRHGARFLDLDAAFPADEFLDNDHLTAAGQRRLARILEAALAHADRRALPA